MSRGRRVKEKVLVLTAEEIEQIEFDEVLESDFRPLTEPEFEHLLESVKQHGFEIPVTLWEKGKRLIIVDGHQRLIIKREYIPRKQLRARFIKFTSLDQARQYAHQQQEGRRNLNAWEQSYRRGLMYLSQKRAPGPQPTRPKTAEMLAGMFKVSERTIKNDAAFARGVDLIAEEYGKQVKTRLLAGSYTKISMDMVRSIGRRTTPLEAFEECRTTEQISRGKGKQRRAKAKRRPRMSGEIADKLLEELFAAVAVADEENRSLANCLRSIAEMAYPFVQDPIIKEKAEEEFRFKG